jgi:hypothetical protein
MSTPVGGRRAFSRGEIWFLIGVPVAWAVLLLFHPTGDGDDIYPVVSDEVTPWLIVHVGTLLFVPLMAGVVYLLLRGVEGREARIARIALAPFVVFYLAFEVLIGIGTGLFADEVNGLPAAQEATGASVIDDFTDSGLIAALETIGAASLLVVLIAAGVALRRRTHAPLAVPILLVLAAVPIAWHVPPFGQAGLLLFVVATLLVVRAQSVPDRAARFEARPTAA